MSQKRDYLLEDFEERFTKRFSWLHPRIVTSRKDERFIKISFDPTWDGVELLWEARCWIFQNYDNWKIVKSTTECIPFEQSDVTLIVMLPS